jgi:UDP-GlcNAc:undecaprenyl-phosphate GlcNAc-1-phosphate transferase
MGGVAIFGGFVTAGGFALWANLSTLTPDDRFRLSGVLLGTVFVFGFAFLDDYFDLPAWPQTAAQFGAALIAIYFTIFIERITLPFFGEVVFPWFITYPLTIFWVMGMINTVNFLDGLNGLAAGVTTIAALLFAWHAFNLGQNVVYLFPLALAGACLGFLPFNFSPARIFMGSTGSYVLGWALASLSILAPAKVATTLLVLGLPIMDVAWLMFTRWRDKGSPFVAGRDHLHFRLLDMGFSQTQIVLGYYSFCLAFGSLALLISSRVYKLIAILLLGGSTLFILWKLAAPQPPPPAASPPPPPPGDPK